MVSGALGVVGDPEGGAGTGLGCRIGQGALSYSILTGSQQTSFQGDCQVGDSLGQGDQRHRSESTHHARAGSSEGTRVGENGNGGVAGG
jgi:hypothetical protein